MNADPNRIRCIVPPFPPNIRSTNVVIVQSYAMKTMPTT